MLLVVDVGNTHTVIGVFDEGRLRSQWRIQTDDARTADEHGAQLTQLLELESLSPDQLEAAVMSCVVPPMESAMVEMAAAYLEVDLQIVGRDISPSMPVKIDHPEEAGADRLVNAEAAWQKHGSSMIIVDFGTATTFDAITSDGAYAGGAIAPGITVSSEALFRSASKLPRVDLDRPASVIGTNTVASIQSGLMFGYIGLVREMVRRMSRELVDANGKLPSGPPKVVATGGYAEKLGAEIQIIDDVDPHLTLRGLQLLYERDRAE